MQYKCPKLPSVICLTLQHYNMALRKDYSEEKLLDLMKHDSEDAFIQIYNRYWQALFNHAYKRLSHRETAQEFIQDLFTELWQKRKTITVHTSLAAFLHQSLKYKILNHVKAEIVREKYVEHLQHNSAISSSSNQVEENILFNELQEALKQEVDHLPPQSKKVYQLKREKGLSYPEISELLDISVSTVEKHMIKALKKIRENLKEHAVSILLLSFHTEYPAWLLV